ncbi:MAG: hypothetical protein M1832_002532 [Thelocarpon impressellum]|nr:MAG: hypothetical protein M1832_002532 [Thelocarpon impressellum]
MTSSRQRSSSARSNNSENPSRAGRSPSPSTRPGDDRGGARPDDVGALDGTAYNPRATGPSLHVPPSYGPSSPYPPNSPYGPPSSPLSRRPRAHTSVESILTQQATYQPSQRPGPGNLSQAAYQPGQRHVSAAQSMDPNRQYVLGPPPPPPPMSPPGIPTHMMPLPPPPPPPPRQPQNPQPVLLPPPPGPPPGSAQIMSAWAQGRGRVQDRDRPPAQGFLPPPPPPSAMGQHLAYNPSQMYQPQHPAPLLIPPPPPLNDSQPLTSATYIPHGESFGPGVGIPALHSNEQQPKYDRVNGTGFPTADGSQDSSVTTPSDGPRQHALSIPTREAQDVTSPGPPTATPANPQANSSTQSDKRGHVHRHSGSNVTNTPVSPSPATTAWPLDRVLLWLAANSFSNDWQETFRILNVHGSEFLELGRGHGGRGNFGMMHQLIYPRLAKECTKSGTGWDQGRERDEGKRMRRLIRRIADSDTARPPKLGPHRPSNDGTLETSPNENQSEFTVNTPSTAGGGEDSPGKQMPPKTTAPPLGNRRMSDRRSTTLPLFSHTGALLYDPNAAENAQAAASNNRTSFARSVFNGLSDVSGGKRHSPSTSTDAATGAGLPGPGFRGEGVRPSTEGSPQSGSPNVSHVPLSASTATSNLSSSPYGYTHKFGHNKSNSTDSMASSPGLAGATSMRVGMADVNVKSNDSRRNAQDGARPAVLDGGRHHGPGNEAPAKDHNRGILSKFRRRGKKDDNAQPSPEDHSLESPTSPVSMRHLMHPGNGTPPFARPSMNSSDPTLDRPSSASAMMEQDRWPAGNRNRWSARNSPGRRFVLATPDGWNYRLVDITDTDSADDLRSLVCLNLGIMDGDFAQLFLTEPGQVDHEEPLSDAMLVQARQMKADTRASLKLFVRAPSTSAVSMPAPGSAGPLQYSHKALPSPPMVLPPSSKLDEKAYARLNSQARKPVQPLDSVSRASTLRAQEAPTREPPKTPLEADRIPAWRDTSSDGSRERVSADGAHKPTDLEIAAEEHRRETERLQKAYLSRKQQKLPKESPPDGSNFGIKREGIIDFDVPRNSPFEDKTFEEKKHDSWVPQRKPPPPPAESNTLIKANSLSKRMGDAVRLSLQDEPENMQPSDAPREMAERGRGQVARHGRATAADGDGKSPSSGRAAGFSFLSSPAREPGGRAPSPQSSHGSPSSTVLKRSKGEETMFKRPDFYQGNPSDKSALGLKIPDNPSLAKFRKDQNDQPQNVSPHTRTPPSRRSYGPDFDFEDNNVTFSRSPRIAQPDSDEDSDDGLFAVPLSKQKAIRPADHEDEQTNASGGRNERPTLTLNTKSRAKKGLSVSFKSPQTSVTTASSTAGPSAQGTGLGSSSLGSSSRDQRQNPDSAASATWSARSSDDASAKLLRRESFADKDVWASRPPAEVLIDRLDDFFPNVDLDQPLALEDSGEPASPTSPIAEAARVVGDSDTTTSHLSSGHAKPLSLGPTRATGSQQTEGGDTLGSEIPASRRPDSVQSVAQRNVRKSGGLGRMKSIREVAIGAQEANRKRQSTPAAGTNTTTNLMRRKSTKMFGANIVQIKPQRGSRLGRLPDVPQDTLPKRQTTFKWVRGQLIGKGTYGRVYLGFNPIAGEFLAVKQVEVNRAAAGQDKDKMKEMVAALDQEIDTMQHLDHENIVQYLGCERKEYSISIFLEYIAGGSVGSCLRKHGKFEEPVVSSLTRQTLFGLAYLHGEGILHRDLKADNILLDLDGTCKISDFGISKKTDNIYGNDVTNSMQGSVFWMAPEVIQSQGQGYSAKVDVWSLGCVVLEMFAGRRPWSKEEAIGAIYKLGSLQAPPIPDDVSSTISPEAIGLLWDCFTIAPSERPTAENLLKHHPFVAFDPNYKFSDTELYAKIRPM